MALRGRYYLWLVKAYIKRWKKTVFFSVIIGIGIFFLFLSMYTFYLQPILERKIEKIGVVGSYEVSNLPSFILNNISYGLTQVSDDDKVVGKAAVGWGVKDNGKKYEFKLKKGLFFHNNKEVTSDKIAYNFKDVEKKIIDKYTIEYTLKAPYAPFIASVSKPILTDGLQGIGEFKVQKVDVNAGFIRSLALQNVRDTKNRKIYVFYPTEESLLLAYTLGEVDRIQSISSVDSDITDFNDWENTTVEYQTNFNKLVTLFYNTQDRNLSDKKLRQALNYALPSQFAQGKESLSPIPPQSIYYNVPATYAIRDLEIAKTLFHETKQENLVLTLSTTKEYEDDAKGVQKAWEAIGIKSKIVLVDQVPSDFQVFLYPFTVPADPDQYTLWHSDQVNNISRYKNLRIDKLLEDGRIITNEDERVKIYSDFQKYLLDDVPASFLYFPYEYTLARK